MVEILSKIECHQTLEFVERPRGTRSRIQKTDPKMTDPLNAPPKLLDPSTLLHAARMASEMP